MESRPFASLKSKIILSLLLGLAVFAGLSLFADLPRMAEALATFSWGLLPAILLLTLFNYLLRFVKWNYYLGQIGVHNLPLRDSATLFFSGLSMVVTPGKVGEWLKSYLLRELTGTPFSASAPVIVAERLTDGLAMLLLASVGLLAYGYGWQFLLAVTVGTAAVVFVSQYPPAERHIFNLASRLPVVAKQVQHLRLFYASSNQLFKPKNLAVAVGLGVVSWFGECFAFYLVLVGLGIEPTAVLLLQATFILATATIVGSVSMLPGGLAAAEGSIAGLLIFLGVTASPAVAGAATLIIRFCTLWFGVAIGMAALVAFMPRLARLGIKLP